MDVKFTNILVIGSYPTLCAKHGDNVKLFNPSCFLSIFLQQFCSHENVPLMKCDMLCQ